MKTLIFLAVCVLLAIWWTVEKDKSKGCFWIFAFIFVGLLFAMAAKGFHLWWIWIISGIAWGIAVFFLFMMFIFRKEK